MRGLRGRRGRRGRGGALLAACMAALLATASTMAAQGVTVIRNATVVPVVGPRVPDATVVIRNGRIEAIGAGAMIIGLLAGVIPYFAVAKLKAMFGYDDALDTFGIHGVGGTLGAILTGLLADPKVNSVITPEIQSGLLMNQIKAIVVTLVLSVVGTAVIAFVVKAILGLRPEEEAETIGLDLVEHGEEAYHGA